MWRWWVQAAHRDFGARARGVLRAAVAAAAGCAAADVSIDGVRRLVQKDSAAGIVVRVAARSGANALAAHAAVGAIRVGGVSTRSAIVASSYLIVTCMVLKSGSDGACQLGVRQGP